MRSILALAATMAVLVGGGVAVASPTGTSKSHAGKAGTAPAAKKTPARTQAPHRCHNGDGASVITALDT
jgi:hypothetical protein